MEKSLQLMASPRQPQLVGGVCGHRLQGVREAQATGGAGGYLRKAQFAQYRAVAAGRQRSTGCTGRTHRCNADAISTVAGAAPAPQRAAAPAPAPAPAPVLVLVGRAGGAGSREGRQGLRRRRHCGSSACIFDRAAWAAHIERRSRSGAQQARQHSPHPTLPHRTEPSERSERLARA